MNLKNIENLTRQLLVEIGENPDREGLLETPKRVAKWYKEFIDFDAGKIDTSFEVVRVDQMVTVSGIKAWSLCEHHMLPFSIVVSVAYLTEKKVIGLSKFARIVQKHSHKLQIQERLTEEIADEIQRITGSSSVAVIVQGVHLCMVMRGVKTPSVMTTSEMRGEFKRNIELRKEFLTVVGLQQKTA